MTRRCQWLTILAMALDMKPVCEGCQAALPHQAVAFVGSYECTFCEGCAQRMAQVCPNCQGELVRRPRRREKTS